ncbi:MAG: ABC transporter permease subunit [Cryomorphaceae bacterium]|nr:ABC transporter permease subunit [Cryomorphaceae bacterium]
MRRITPILLLTLYVLPLAMLAALSVAATWEYPRLLPDVQLNLWSRVVVGGAGWSFLTSLQVALPVAVISLVLGFLSSYRLLGSRYRHVWLWMALIPFCTAPVILSLEMQYYFIRFGLTAQRIGVVIGQLLIGIPYATVLFSLFWNADRLKQEEAARTLGCSRLQIMQHIHIPAAGGIMKLVFAQLFLFSWFEYGMTQMLGVGQVQTLPVLIFRSTQEANLALAAGACVVLILLPVIFIIFTRKIVFR